MQVRDLSSLASTCKELRQLASADHLWKPAFLREFPSASLEERSMAERLGYKQAFAVQWQVCVCVYVYVCACTCAYLRLSVLMLARMCVFAFVSVCVCIKCVFKCELESGCGFQISVMRA
jgi:hypothetical protein